MRALNPAGDSDQDDTDRLAQLRAEFPQFDISREVTRDRIRYVSRRLHPNAQPHTVVTADLDELRAALSSRSDGQRRE